MPGEYLEKYIEGCKIHGSGTDCGDDYRTVNKAYDVLIKNFRILIKEEGGKELLKELLRHDSVYVSAWTATLLIFDYPKECKKVIKSVAKGKGVWALSIKTFYDEWKKGNTEKQY